MKARYVKGGLGLASVLLLAVAIGTASAADNWILLGEKILKSTDPSTEIKAEEGKMWKEDVKKAKLSVEGADVEITNVVFHWKGGKNETIPNVGVVKAGAETAAKDAPDTRGDPLVGERPVQDPQQQTEWPPSKSGDSTKRV